MQTVAAATTTTVVAMTANSPVQEPERRSHQVVELHLGHCIVTGAAYRIEVEDKKGGHNSTKGEERHCPSLRHVAGVVTEHLTDVSTTDEGMEIVSYRTVLSKLSFYRQQFCTRLQYEK